MPAANKPIPTDSYTQSTLLTAISRLADYFSDDFTLSEMRLIAQQANDEYRAEEARRTNERLDTPVVIKILVGSTTTPDGNFTAASVGDTRFVEMALSRRKRYTVVVRDMEQVRDEHWRSVLRQKLGKDGKLKVKSFKSLAIDYAHTSSTRWITPAGQRRRFDTKDIVSITEEAN